MEQIRALEPRARAYLRRVTRDAREIDALLADMVAELWCTLALHTPPEPVWPQALDVLRRIARTERRRNRREASVVDLDPPSRALQAEERQEYRVALAAWADAMLAHLGTSQRTALELHVMEDWSDEQIAVVLDCKVESVRKLRYKAKQVCRALARAGLVHAPPMDPGLPDDADHGTAIGSAKRDTMLRDNG